MLPDLRVSLIHPHAIDIIHRNVDGVGHFLYLTRHHSDTDPGYDHHMEGMKGEKSEKTICNQPTDSHD